MEDYYYTKDRFEANFLFMANGYHERPWNEELKTKTLKRWDGKIEIYLGFPGLIENTRASNLWKQGLRDVMGIIYQSKHAA